MFVTQTLPTLHEDGSIDIDLWLRNLLSLSPKKNSHLLKQATILAQLAGEDQATPTGESCLAQGLMIADILNDLHVDDATLAAAIVYSSAFHTDLKTEDIAEHLGNDISKLVQGTKQMASISDLYLAISTHEQQKHNIDNIRKMLLAMVDDVRIVLIKLAERLCVLRRANIFANQVKRQIAQETMAIYAPLANRLGIIQIKFEMEDLAFSYLEPEQYQKISQFLKQSQIERDLYVQEVIAEMENILKKANLKDFQVSGRAKHIFSIYRKMQRKNVAIEDIYDVSAIRILVSNVQDCYASLSAVHSNWQVIPKEFDDYIATPKENGYQSIHTAVVGPKGKNVEIQIRTYEMHRIAELGVAAHWIYKEDIPQKSDYETKIAWLRRIMDWQQEITAGEDELNEVRRIFSDRVYVFTPAGDILELPKGATPIDFAYHVHSELGHRCRGAKIDGSIVPLTYQLKTSEHVEILAGKRSAPSRDWLNPHLGFLKTSRAKTKVLHWFKKQDYKKNVALGAELLNSEFKRLNIKDIDLKNIASNLSFKSNDDLLASLGSGDTKIGAVMNILQQTIKLSELEKTIEVPKIAIPSIAKPSKMNTDIHIHGIANLLTHIAQCCGPIPGDEIVGYITQGRGLSIHRKDCINILNASLRRPEKILNVSWGGKTEHRYPIELLITAYDRTGLVRDITNVIANENSTIRGLNFIIDKDDQLAYVTLTIEISGLLPLSRILTKISKIPNVIEAKRRG